MDDNLIKLIDDLSLLSINDKLFKSRQLFLPENIDITSSNKLISSLLLLDEYSSTEPITLYINSNGGEVEGGLLAIYDTITSLKAPIKTLCVGEANSSAAFILASGTKGLRAAFANSKIMIHGVQYSDFSGDQENFKQEIKSLKKLNETLSSILVKHTGQTLSKIKKDLKKEKILSAQEALDYGIIDMIIAK